MSASATQGGRKNVCKRLSQYMYVDGAVCVYRLRARQLSLDGTVSGQRLRRHRRGDRHRSCRSAAGATGRHGDRRDVEQPRRGAESVPPRAALPSRYVQLRGVA